VTRILLTLSAFAFIAATIISPSASAQDFTDAQEAAIKEMFKEYLIENGEVILESVNKYQGELVEKEQAAANEKAKEFVKDIQTRDGLAVAGNPKGDITVVEFFDYNCGYCMIMSVLS